MNLPESTLQMLNTIIPVMALYGIYTIIRVKCSFKGKTNSSFVRYGIYSLLCLVSIYALKMVGKMLEVDVSETVSVLTLVLHVYLVYYLAYHIEGFLRFPGHKQAKVEKEFGQSIGTVTEEKNNPCE